MLLLCSSMLFAAGIAYYLKSNYMAKIQFDLGKNIHETAKRSGAPKFATRNVAGLISYKLLDLPPDIPATYQRPGYEITAFPLFAFTLYADTENRNDLAVETASLQFSSDTIKSHESAKAFVENQIAQFQRGQWKRFIHELCPAVTGRSSLLDETGSLDQTLSCPLDPQYRLSMEDWISMVGRTQDYQWLGDDILATLTVGFSNDIRGLTYSVRLEFQDFSIKNRRESERTLHVLTEGDAAGRNSTAKRAKELVEARIRIKTLEEKAIERGDKVVPR
jgi:hypothetical protein